MLTLPLAAVILSALVAWVAALALLVGALADAIRALGVPLGVPLLVLTLAGLATWLTRRGWSGPRNGASGSASAAPRKRPRLDRLESSHQN